MRVLLVSHSYPQHRSGIEIIAGEIAGRLVRRGCSVHWAASGPLTEPLPDGVTAVPMTSWNFTENRFGFPYPLWGPLSLLRLLLEASRADVIHLHDTLYMGTFFAYLFAQLYGKPVVVTQHIGLIAYSSPVLRRLMAFANRTVARLVLGGAEACAMYNVQVYHYFRRFVPFRRRPYWIENGVSLKSFFPLPETERAVVRRELGWDEGETVLLFVGRFVEKKGLRLLRRLTERFADCQWVFIGSGPEDPRAWNLSNVQCPGSMDRKDIRKYYQATDLFVLPSFGEGFPLVVQESMACGTPALISSETAAGVPGIEAVTFVAELDPERLASTVASALGDRAALQAMRSRVADYARQTWDWEVCADHYRQLFTIVSGRNSSEHHELARGQRK
jgi:glycosyltransferase involved in cell wall biosynthesis